MKCYEQVNGAIICGEDGRNRGYQIMDTAGISRRRDYEIVLGYCGFVCEVEDDHWFCQNSEGFMYGSPMLEGVFH